jgi:hypothetical protein
MQAAQSPLAVAVAVALALVLEAPVAGGAGDIAPGAYCPLPEKGQTPQCLLPAKQEYGEFFTALDEGEFSDADAARLERDVASGAASDTPYLAISSLSYGYYRLAQQAADNADEDPAVVARLQRWNQLLAQAFDASAQDPAYREAVHAAALDLRERAPGVRLECLDERGDTTTCDSTEAVLRGFNRAGEQVGIRGALDRLIHRMLAGDDS